ncbi:MAG: hypothetical protein CSA32_05175 [Desulfobulbus propionicus]|nr:MAG: hypothetical protein CSA32_05175 [Desulfobulbus propionicus]
MKDKRRQDSSIDRRTYLRKWFVWSFSLAVLTLGYPLTHYIGFKKKPKPRYIEVKGPLPLSGYHTERDFILFADDNSAHAVSRTCTHLGCRVHYLEDKGYIECPCHQSRFTPQGIRIAGPAEKDLPVYPVERHKNQAGQIIEYIVELS